jgi:hypothetical protein
LLAKPCPQNMFHFFFFSSSASPSPQAMDKLARLCLPRRGRRRHRQATDAKKKHARATTTGSHSREPKTKLLSIDTHGKTEASMCPFCSKEKSAVVATMPRCAMDRRLGQVRQKSTAGARRRLSTYVCTCSAPCFYTAGRKASQWRLPAGQRPDTTRPVHRLWIISAHATTSPKQSKTKRRLEGALQSNILSCATRASLGTHQWRHGRAPSSKQQVPQSLATAFAVPWTMPVGH